MSKVEMLYLLGDDALCNMFVALRIPCFRAGLPYIMYAMQRNVMISNANVNVTIA